MTENATWSSDEINTHKGEFYISDDEGGLIGQLYTDIQIESFTDSSAGGLHTMTIDVNSQPELKGKRISATSYKRGLTKPVTRPVTLLSNLVIANIRKVDNDLMVDNLPQHRFSFGTKELNGTWYLYTIDSDKKYLELKHAAGYPCRPASNPDYTRTKFENQDAFLVSIEYINDQDQYHPTHYHCTLSVEFDIYDPDRDFCDDTIKTCS